MQEASDALSKTADSDTVSTYQVSSVHGRRSSKQFGGAPNFCPKNLSLQLNFAQKNFQHIIYGNGIKITNFEPQMLTAKKSIH